jgi:hypothetical protein
MSRASNSGRGSHRELATCDWSIYEAVVQMDWNVDELSDDIPIPKLFLCPCNKRMEK